LADTNLLHAICIYNLVSEPYQKGAFRLNLADATSNEEIEQQLADPWSDTQVWDAFQETLAGWKAKTRPKRMTGGMPGAHWFRLSVHVLMAHALLQVVAVKLFYENSVSP